MPVLFPTNQLAIRNSLVVAPFWSDVDVRLEGRIYFKKFVRTLGSEQDIEWLNFVSGYIANKQSDATNFTGNTMLVAQWQDVPPYPHGAGNIVDLLDSFTSKVRIVYNNGCVLELAVESIHPYLLFIRETVSRPS